MKAFIAFLLLVLCSVHGVAAVNDKPCNWDHPGTNKYTRAPAEALKDYVMDYRVRATLQVKMNKHWYDDVVEITKHGIFGEGTYTNMRGMHYGQAHYCPGNVDTSGWSKDQTERALVYCVAETCVAVPTVCNNVSLVDRKQEEGPIDILPAAGNPNRDSEPSVDVASLEPGPILGEQETAAPLGFLEGDAKTFDNPEGEGHGVPGFMDGGQGNGGWGGGGGDDTRPCRICHLPEPPCPPPVIIPPTVPETPEWMMMGAGLACFLWLWNRRDKRR